MAGVVVIGAGLGGLSTAMLLAQDGHDVTVLERDPAPPPTSPEDAWEGWERRGVNQFRLPHFLLARWREIAEQELPEVVHELEAWGALRINILTALPERVTGGWQDGDERADSITARRPVIEGAMARVAASTFGVAVRRGLGVRSLLTDGRHGVAPHVIGVQTETGDDIPADLVVDTTGRRSPLPNWLSAIGARAPVEICEDSGFVYYGRHYQGDSLPDIRGWPLEDYESVSLLTLPADNMTWSVTFVASAKDTDLRALRDPDRFDAALSHYPLAAHWKEGKPISGIDVMAKIEDRYRRFSVEGEPVVTGLVAVADAWACTNPSLGRGATLALLHGCALRDVLGEVGTSDAAGLARRWDEVTEERLTPHYDATVSYDRHRLAEIDADIAGERYEPNDPVWSITKAVTNGSEHDPFLLRFRAKVANLLGAPEEELAKPGAFESVAAAAGRPRRAPGPDRAMLVSTVVQ